ncbi:MAG TPA: PilN domain-containing protein [Tepidisphaeraceae bacterium]|nr:PilN domain-containing protein [Tepidisphaeraceae bacterium]
MREVEFLPRWYPQVRRRRRYVMLQAWMTVIVMLALGLWMMQSGRNIRREEATLRTREAELSASRSELKVVEELMTLRKKLVEQSKVLSKVGTHTEAARLLATLDEVMPRSTALLELSLLTEETHPITLAGARAAQDKEPSVDRRLIVRVTGIAPTDVEVADFLTRLTGKPFFEDVRMTGSKPRVDDGRVMREFEVYFSMNLNDLAGA